MTQNRMQKSVTHARMPYENNTQVMPEHSTLNQHEPSIVRKKRFLSCSIHLLPPIATVMLARGPCPLSSLKSGQQRSRGDKLIPLRVKSLGSGQHLPINYANLVQTECPHDLLVLIVLFLCAPEETKRPITVDERPPTNGVRFVNVRGSPETHIVGGAGHCEPDADDVPAAPPHTTVLLHQSTSSTKDLPPETVSHFKSVNQIVVFLVLGIPCYVVHVSSVSPRNG